VQVALTPEGAVPAAQASAKFNASSFDSTRMTFGRCLPSARERRALYFVGGCTRAVRENTAMVYSKLWYDAQPARRQP
jgi:hypothetical protein